MKKFNILAAILAITGLLTLALLKDIDGAALSGGIAILAGLGGYSIAKSK